MGVGFDLGGNVMGGPGHIEGGMDWGLGPEGSEGVRVGHSEITAGEDRDISPLEQKQAFMVKNPLGNPTDLFATKTPTQPVASVSFYLEDESPSTGSLGQPAGLTSEQQGSFVPQAFRTLAGDKNKTMAALEGVKYEGYPFSVLEAAGFTYGKRPQIDFIRKTAGDPILSQISLVDAFKNPSVAGQYTSGTNKITLKNEHLYNPDTIRHEGMHNLVDNMARKGNFRMMPFDEAQGIIDKFDLETSGTKPSVQDFINFVGLESNFRQKQAGMTETVMNADGTFSPAWDPRMRSTGWDYNKIGQKSGVGNKSWEDILPGFKSNEQSMADTLAARRQQLYGSSPPWEGSSKKGKEEWDKWVAYQRELPSESMGGAVAGYGSKTVPWGPATVWMDENMQPIGTGSGFANTSVQYTGQSNVPLIQSQTGLGNWPMAYVHALTQAQAQKYGGEQAKFNKSAALTAHPDSRIRALYEANIPEKVLDKIQDYLLENKWTPTMHYEEVMNYLNNMMVNEQ
jgi:hypothetical protein